MGWADNYDPEATGGGRVVPGVQKLIIVSAGETVARSGADMITIEVKLAVNERFELKHNMVIDSEYFSKSINAFFDSAKLPHAPASLAKAVGRTAWGMVQYQKKPADSGKCYLELSYFVTEDQKDRPPERPTPPNGATAQTGSGHDTYSGDKQGDGFTDDIPF